MGLDNKICLCKHPVMSDAITPEQREMLLKAIENPPRGSALERAKRWGVQLHTFVDNLCLTPTDRAFKFSRVANLMRGRAKKETASQSHAKEKHGLAQ